MGVRMDSHGAWDLFLDTGSVYAYMIFKELSADANIEAKRADCGEKEEKNAV
jgi:hypothetical protein